MLHVHLHLTVIYFICFYFIFLFFIFYILNFFCFCFCICCICGFLSIWTLRSVFTWDIYFYLLAYQECSSGGFAKSLEEIFCGTPQQSWFCFFSFNREKSLFRFWMIYNAKIRIKGWRIDKLTNTWITFWLRSFNVQFWK